MCVHYGSGDIAIRTALGGQCDSRRWPPEEQWGLDSLDQPKRLAVNGCQQRRPASLTEALPTSGGQCSHHTGGRCSNSMHIEWNLL